MSVPSDSKTRRLARVLTGFPARAVVTASLLALLALSVDWSRVAERLEHGRWTWFALAVALLFCGLLLGARRWHALLVAAGIPASGGEALRAYMVGSFANNFLPTGFGGDAVRAVMVAGGRPGLARAAGTVLLDRITALGCLLLLGWLVLPLDPSAVPGELVAALAAASAAGVLGALALGRSFTSPRLRRLVPERVLPAARELRVPLRALAGDRRLLLRVTVLGLAYQALTVASVWAAARSIRLELPFVLVAVTVPLVLLLTVLPVSVAGFGVREGGYAVALGTAGVGTGEAALLSLLTVAVLAAASLAGAYFMLTHRRPADVVA